LEGTIMDQQKITEQAGQLASKAAKVGGQAKDRATVIAGEVVHRAGPIAGQARTKAADLAHKAGPVAAHGVHTTASKLDQLTRGKYSDRIKSVSTTLEHLLDRGPHPDDAAGPPSSNGARANGVKPEPEAPAAGPGSAAGRGGAAPRRAAKGDTGS
jgi:hypothetical protein